MAPSINAGLDLEMPGVNKWRTQDKVGRSIVSRKLMVRTVKERATKVLDFVQRCAQGAPEVRLRRLLKCCSFIECEHRDGQVLDGDGLERTNDPPESTALMRSLAAASIVLLKNDASLLPLNAEALKGKKVAILGGNAKALVLSGGGSAALKPSYFISPFEGIVNALGEGVDVGYCEGARGQCFVTQAAKLS